MALLALCMPILPGKKEKWQGMMEQITQQPAKNEVDAIRENSGVHERAFLQETPNGDFLIITLEGDDPADSFGKILESLPEDFTDFVKDVHGVDVTAAPPPLPTLVYDSRS